jgi:hypothetical protein
MKHWLKCLIFIAAVFVGISGCGFKNKDFLGKEKGDEIMNCLKTGNSEDLKDMFCTELKNSEGFDEKIDEIMSFIDGEIISYNIPIGNGGRGETWERLEPNVKDVETDKGNFYRIYISIYIENENPEKLGIHYLQIYLLGDKGENGIRQSIDDVELYTE